MARARNISQFIARIALVLAALLSLAGAARAHVDPILEEDLYEVSVVWTSLELKNDGDTDIWTPFGLIVRDGDIIFNSTVEEVGHEQQGKVYSYANHEQLSYTDTAGKVMLDSQLPLYEHQHCHLIRGAFNVTFQILDDDASFLLSVWNWFVGQVRSTLIGRAKDALMSALFSGGNPALTGLQTLVGEETRMAARELAQRMGASGGVAGRAQRLADKAMEGLLGEIPVLGDALHAIDDARAWLEARVEEILTTIYDTLFGWVLAERPETELLGDISFTVTPPPDEPNLITTTTPRVLELTKDTIPGIGGAIIGYEFHQKRAPTWGRAASCTKLPPTQTPSTEGTPPQSGSGSPPRLPAARRSATPQQPQAGQPAQPAPAPPAPASSQPRTPPTSTEPPLPAAPPGPSAAPSPAESPSETAPPPAGDEEAPPEEPAQGEEIPPETAGTAEPEKKPGRRLRSVLGGVARELIAPAPTPGPVLTRSPQLSRCADMLGANTGREHRAEGARRRSSGLSFVREDLRLYIDSKEPQITEEMKQCARLLLAFLDGNSTAGDRNWIVGIYETAYERGYSGG